MSEWYLVPLLIGFAIGFVCGLIYSLRLYKKFEATYDREWAKRRGMREADMPGRELSGRVASPVLRRRRL